MIRLALLLAVLAALLLTGCVWLNPFEPYDEPCVTTVYFGWEDTTMVVDSVTVEDPDSTGICAEVGS